MIVDEVDYFEQRAAAELELAQRSSDSRAVQAHYELATLYLDRIHGEVPRSEPNALAA